MDSYQIRTARSFGFEWQHFSEMYTEWESSFLEYVQPHTPDFFRGKRILDAGCGSGRHAHYAALYGGEVWAVDLGPAVEVARKNTATCGEVRVLQADLHHLPFTHATFDFIYSFGVLHHLPDPEMAFKGLIPFVKPGGEIQIYLYWFPENQPIKRILLACVALIRQLTVRLPHALLYRLSYPLAGLAFLFFVWPYKLLSKVPFLRQSAERLPMKQYARYPFRVCVNDQFDRFSAPIENRYTKNQVLSWLTRAGLEAVSVWPCYGWIGSGRRPKNGNTGAPFK